MFNRSKRQPNAKNEAATASKNSRRNKLRMESLESRRLLAGDVSNVSVEVVDGNLVIRGDQASNQIEVYQVGDGTAAYVIRGLVGEDGVQTTVNGAERIAVDGVTGDVLASMNRGDDVIYIHDADLPGALKIRTGAGNDTVLIGGLPRDGTPIPGPLPRDVIDAVFFADQVREVDVAPVDPTDPVPIDPVPIDPVSILPIANVTIAGSASISTSLGQDRIGMGSVEVMRNLSISTGRQDDFLQLGLNELPGPTDGERPSVIGDGPTISLPLNVRGNLNLSTGRGADSAWLESVQVGRDMRAVLGAGDDVLSFDWGRIGGRLGVYGGSGDDLIGIAHLAADQIAIRTGRGADGVGLSSVRAGRIGVGLGAGNDRMRVANTTARVARFHGGSGTDSLEFQGENELHDLAILSFEVIS